MVQTNLKILYLWSTLKLPCQNEPYIRIPGCEAGNVSHRLLLITYTLFLRNFSDGSVIKNLPDNAEDVRDETLIPGSGRSSGGANCSPLQYSCLGNSMHKEAWQSMVHGAQRVRHNWATNIASISQNDFLIHQYVIGKFFKKMRKLIQ